jgi:hypothetical protein
MPMFTSITGGRDKTPNPSSSGSNPSKKIDVRFARTSGSSAAAIGSAFHVDKQGSADARALVLGSAQSFGEILSCIPRSYVETLRQPLRHLSTTAAKSVGVNLSLDNLNRHLAAKTWPPALMGVHFPKIEVTSEFEASKPGILADMISSYDSYRAEALSQAVQLKTEELVWLRKQLEPQMYFPSIANIVEERFTQIQKLVKLPSWKKDDNGNTTLDAWVNAPSVKKEYDNLVVDLPNICGRVILLEETRYIAEARKKEAKIKLKADADVEMGDATISTQAISDVVEKKVAAAFKKLSVSVSPEALETIRGVPNLSLLGKRFWSTEEERQRQKRRRLESEIDDYGSTTPAIKWEEVAKTARQQPKEQEVEEIVEKIISTNIRYENPASYPDELLLIPRPLAIRLLLRAAPLEVLDAARFRGGVHIGPGVNLPDYISMDISAGARYLLHTMPSRNLLLSTWEDFCNRLRWRIYWMQKIARGDAQDKTYDPDYELSHETNICDYRIDYIERGLEQGRAYIDGFITEVVPSLQRAHRVKPNLASAKTAFEYCKENDYLILPTDKNLGQCVVTRQWFISLSNSLLEDQNNYDVITKERAKEILDSQRNKMESLATFAGDILKNEQLSSFLRSNIPQDDDHPNYKLPKFYGIPKIHKHPVKMRPIVPCHSAMQNPAAKYVSKNLKPVIDNLRFVIKGTKDMAMKLAKLELIPGRKFFLVGFDLVAYYPNIPTEACVESCRRLYKEVCKPSLEEQAAMRQALNVSFKNLIFEFDGRYFQQKNGIAMGIACAPDGANIYAGVYEEVALQHGDLPLHPRIPFYGRYIDDGFMIVYADSAEEALAFCKKTVKIGNLELTWEVSEYSLPFLDMLIYIDPITKKVQWKPFRKARNNLERIPFSSHHPLDIKRGTFLGEMTRMAILSSSPANYLDALRDLSGIYIARGYPVALVKKWLKEQTSRRWHNRFNESRRSITTNPAGSGNADASKLLVLKSYFNPVWDAFNVQELGQVIVRTWVNELSQLDRAITRLYDSGSRSTTVVLREERIRALKQSRRTGRGEAVSETPSAERAPVVGSVHLPVGEVTGRDTLYWESVSVEVLRKMRPGVNMVEIARILDVREVGLTDARWLISRKRTRSLGDVFNQLKREALSSAQLDEIAAVSPMSVDDGDESIEYMDIDEPLNI